MDSAETLTKQRIYALPVSLQNAAGMITYIITVKALVFVAFSHWAYDDPFITYRYAQNLANGIGFVYNPGERVLSTTTPLFTMLLAALSFVWPDLQQLANFIGAFSIALGAIFLWQLASVWNVRPAGWISLFLYPLFPLLLTSMGSETPLYIALCLGALVAYSYHRLSWTAAFAALSLLARPDGILIPGIIIIHYVITNGLKKPLPWKPILIFLALTVPWFIFSWVYFGSPLPVTLAAKQQQGEMAISQRFAPGFISLVSMYGQRWLYRIEAGLAFIGLLYLLLRNRKPALIITWTFVYFTAYTLLGVSRYYWYYAPLVPGFVFLVGLGITAIYQAITSLQRSKLGSKQPTSALLAALILIPLTVLHFQNVSKLQNQPDRRASIYQAIGEWLAQNTPEDAKVGTLEIGIIGYYAQRPMIDFAGLIQPETAKQLMLDTTYEDAALWSVERFQPDYLVLYRGGFPEVEQKYVADQCNHIQQFMGADYNFTSDIDIYHCP